MTEDTPPDRETDDLGLTHEEWMDLRFAYNFGTIDPAPGPSKPKRSPRWTSTPGAKSSASPMPRRPRRPGGRPGAAAHRRPDRNQRPGNDHPGSGPGRDNAGEYTQWQAQPASPGQHEAARDYLTRLRQDGGTYRSIAATAALSPATVHALATGRRRAQPATATAVLRVTSRSLPRERLDATGTRLRLRALHVMGHGSARIARAAGVHPRPSASSSAATPALSACGCATPSSPSTTRGGTSARPAAPASTAPRPPPPATAPSPGTGAPPPPWTTTNSTAPATGPARAGNQPPAPAPPPTSARPPATTGRTAHDQR